MRSESETGHKGGLSGSVGESAKRCGYSVVSFDSGLPTKGKSDEDELESETEAGKGGETSL